MLVVSNVNKAKGIIIIIEIIGSLFIFGRQTDCKITCDDICNSKNSSRSRQGSIAEFTWQFGNV